MTNVIPKYLISHSSRLKDDDNMLKSIGSKMCLLCDLGSPEDTIHMIMQCPAHEKEKGEMFSDIDEITQCRVEVISVYNLLGKPIDGILYAEMIEICKNACTYICNMY